MDSEFINITEQIKQEALDDFEVYLGENILEMKSFGETDLYEFIDKFAITQPLEMFKGIDPDTAVYTSDLIRQYVYDSYHTNEHEFVSIYDIITKFRYIIGEYALKDLYLDMVKDVLERLEQC